MASADAQFLDLRVTDDSASIEVARSEVKGTAGNSEDAARYILPDENGPQPVDAAASRLIESMIDCGLVPASVYERALRAITWPSYSSCPQNNYVFWQALKVAGMTLCMGEVDGVCPHDHVAALKDYSAASQGSFSPQAIFQATKDVETQEDYDDIEFPILAQFIANERLYRFRLLQLGFIPDGNALDAVVNRVLADQSGARRFIQIDVQDLGGDIYAVPDLLSEFCARYDIHVYGFEEASARRVTSLPPIWEEWNNLVKKRGEKMPKKRRR